MLDLYSQKLNRFREFVDEMSTQFRDMFGKPIKIILTETIKSTDLKRSWFSVHSDSTIFPWKGKIVKEQDIKKIEDNYDCINLVYQESPRKAIRYRIYYEQSSSTNLKTREFQSIMQYRLELHFRGMVEDLQDEVKVMSLSTRDLTSFFHKCINKILPKYIDFNGASAFYFDNDSNSLVLASTTGLRQKSNTKSARRSSIRYQMDDKSFCVRSFLGEKCIIEYNNDMNLKNNTYGEDIEEIYQRTYFPIQIRDALLDKENSFFGSGSTGTHAIGVLRILNVSTYGYASPISMINYCILKHFCEFLSVLGERYVAGDRLSQDLERATHGFSTDLTTLRIAVQLAHRYQDVFAGAEAQLLGAVRGEMDEARIERAVEQFITNSSATRREVHIQLQNAMTVQDSMAFQVMNVHLHTERGVFRDLFRKDAKCIEPYRDVFMRVAGSLEPMSSTYDRKRAKLTWAKPHSEFGIQELPSLAVPSELMYLVVRNLVENSIKYCPSERTPEIQVDWRVSSDQIEFGFKDNGIGIQEEEVHKIFREGWRSRVANEYSLRGNGLGLAVCKSVLEDFDGRLFVAGKGLRGNGVQFNLVVKTG